MPQTVVPQFVGDDGAQFGRTENRKQSPADGDAAPRPEPPQAGIGQPAFPGGDLHRKPHPRPAAAPRASPAPPAPPRPAPPRRGRPPPPPAHAPPAPPPPARRPPAGGAAAHARPPRAPGC